MIVETLTAKKSLDELISLTNASFLPVTILGKNGESSVLIGEAEWRGIVETMNLSENPDVRVSIVEGMGTPLAECVPYDPDEKW